MIVPKEKPPIVRKYQSTTLLFYFGAKVLKYFGAAK